MLDCTTIKQAKLNIIAYLFNSNSILFSIIRTTFRIIVNYMKYCKITIINHPLISYHITNISNCIYAVGFYCFFYFNAYMVPSNDNFHDIKKGFSIPISIFKTCYHIPTNHDERCWSKKLPALRRLDEIHCVSHEIGSRKTFFTI